MDMPRTSATFSVSLPPEMAEELERVRRNEHRTRSELVREALRTYIRQADVRGLQARIAKLPEEAADADELEAITEGRAELRRRNSRKLNRSAHELHHQRRRPRTKKS